MRYFYRIVLLRIVIFCGILFGCKSTENVNLPISEDILINQQGYSPEASKVVLVKSYSGTYKLVNLDSKKTVFEGKTKELGEWKFSGENYSEIDFSVLSTEGSYELVINDSIRSWPIIIRESLYSPLLKALLKSYYFNRCSFAIDSLFGGEWTRKAGHPDTAVFIHESAASNNRKTGTVISSPGGWYDAGDYNKYIVNSAITTYTLLLAYEQYQATFDSLKFDIPESKNEVPDILDETIYNIRWMLTMQDSDGGVYHKLTTLNFEDFVMPKDAVADRFVVMKSTPATLDFAASIAACSRIIASNDKLKPLADSCLIASKMAWEWAAKNPSVFYVQPADVTTGEYNDTCLTDEWMWASVEMYLATNNLKYIGGKSILGMTQPFITPSWDVVQTLGLISIVTNPESFDKDIYQLALSKYLSMVDDLYAIYEKSPARISLDYYKWGSNSDVANQVMMSFIAFKLTGNSKYALMGQDNIDYLLGRNPTGYSYVTGIGYQSPKNIHHRPSGADAVENPIPGFLVGGPNTIVLNDCDNLVKRSTYPALSYTDLECSYSTNEIAINWNAPMVFAIGAIVDMNR